MNDTAAPGGAGLARSDLSDSLSRFIALYRVEDGVRQASARLQAIRAGEAALWEPLPTSVRAEQSFYFLPSVAGYFGGLNPSGDSTPAVEAFRWRDAAVSLIPRELTTEGVHTRFCFRLAGCELYLFSTGIGALVFECTLLRTIQNGKERTPTLPDLARFNYWMRYVEDRQDKRIRAVDASENPGIGTPTEGVSTIVRDAAVSTAHTETLADIFARGAVIEDLARWALGPLGSVNSLEGPAFRVQTFARLAGPTPIEDHRAEFYLLRTVAKRGHLPAPADLPYRRNPAVVQTHGNTVAGCSLEGMAILLVDRVAPGRTPPFFDHYIERVRTSHFAHYLLALHQRSALQSLAMEASGLPDIAHADLGPAELERVRHLRRRAIDFNLHHRFVLVSTITNYDRIYQMLVRTLHIPELVEEVRDEVREMEEVLRQEAVDVRDRAAVRAAAQQQWLNFMVAVFGVLGVLFALFGTNLPPYSASAISAYFDGIGSTPSARDATASLVSAQGSDLRILGTPFVLVPVLVAVVLILILAWRFRPSATRR